jgi:hypothetical protein
VGILVHRRHHERQARNPDIQRETKTEAKKRLHDLTRRLSAVSTSVTPV